MIERLLFAAPHTGVPGPIRAHTNLLAEAFTDAGVATDVRGWGRHADGETLLEKIWGRFDDIAAILNHLQTRAPEALVIRTAHDWKTLARDIPLVWLARRRTCHVAIQFHGSQIDRARAGTLFGAFTSMLTSHADGVLLLSSEEAIAWKARFPSLKTAVVANAFLPWQQAVCARDRRIGDELADGIHLIYVGRLIPEKGAMEAVEAVALAREVVEVRLTIVGKGVDEARLRERADALGIGEFVHFAGQLDRAALADVYLSAQCLVLPTYWAEGFPTVLSEAMSFGLPIITTAARGALDYLESGVNCVYVPARDSAAVAAAVVGLCHDPDGATAMGSANQILVERFLPQRVAPEYLSALASLMGDVFAVHAGISDVRDEVR